MCENESTAAAVLIHESVHYLDKRADREHDSPEWYLSGANRLVEEVNRNGALVQVEIEYYDRLTPDVAVHNPSSYNAFCQHVFFGDDTRRGVEVRRGGY